MKQPLKIAQQNGEAIQKVNKGSACGQFYSGTRDELASGGASRQGGDMGHNCILDDVAGYDSRCRECRCGADCGAVDRFVAGISRAWREPACGQSKLESASFPLVVKSKP